jgi:hypothetical protein
MARGAGQRAKEPDPKPGDRVWFKLNYRIRAGVHPSVPPEGRGVVVRVLTKNRAESCDYEVEVAGHGRLCFYRSEMVRWHYD